MKIFIVGYMGAGKSTIGKKLAKKLNLTFIDLDEMIEEESGMSPFEIFESHGEDSFRIKEKELLNKILQLDNFVLSTGGGTACFFNNMQKMNDAGLTIYLEMNAGILSHRIKHSKIKRPLAADKNDKELTSFIIKQLDERKKFYEQAKHIIKGNYLKIDELLEIIK